MLNLTSTFVENIYSQIDFELSRVKLQSKVPEGEQTSLRISGVSSYRGLSYRGLNYSKYMRQIQGKLVLLRVSGEFELPRVRVIGVQLYFRNRDFLFFVTKSIDCCSKWRQMLQMAATVYERKTEPSQHLQAKTKTHTTLYLLASLRLY